jgi:hypothetical protein
MHGYCKTGKPPTVPIERKTKNTIFFYRANVSTEQELADKIVSPLYPVLIGKFVYTIPIAEKYRDNSFSGMQLITTCDKGLKCSLTYELNSAAMAGLLSNPAILILRRCGLMSCSSNVLWRNKTAINGKRP